MKTKMLILATLLLSTSCEKEENYKPCGASTVSGAPTFSKKGKCYLKYGVFTWNRYKRTDKSECPCL